MGCRSGISLYRKTPNTSYASSHAVILFCVCYVLEAVHASPAHLVVRNCSSSNLDVGSGNYERLTDRQQAHDQQVLLPFQKRSILTKVPPWVKWSMQRSTTPRSRGGVTPSSALYNSQYDRNTRENSGSRQALPGDAQSAGGSGGGSAKSTNVVCFFNPVSCFGRRASSRAM